ncbi:Transmembrane anterior posterior transformation protein 1 [Homalodisca vitripennis]|nr:Transmembrane anterior posterior transformation protein 1 [Homalodisca vitripennis]
MGPDDKGVSKKIKFRSISTTTEPLLGSGTRVEDLSTLRQRSKSEQKYKKKDTSDNSDEEDPPSLLKFLGVELTRGYILEHDEEQYTARREKVYSFAKIPVEAEKFMAYGFFQCADSYLFVYTFLPVRFILAVWALVTRPICSCFGYRSSSKSLLKPAEICDLLKVAIVVLCTVFMFCIDTSMMYHLIKSQSVIKLYIFYNMLEVGDRLFSALGQDLIDSLFWTATEPRGRKRDHIGVLPHFVFVVIYVILHSLLVLCQATTLNVAINSSNKALLTIMISNNFVELKGSVFKKFDKNNLFQVACSDVRERFHLFVLLFIVVLQTMKEYSWKEAKTRVNLEMLSHKLARVSLPPTRITSTYQSSIDYTCSHVDECKLMVQVLHADISDNSAEPCSLSCVPETLWLLVPDCVIVLLAEMIVDWVKHAFITRFNELPFMVYRDYTLSLAYDMAQTRQKNAFTDHSDLVARRMGFIPLPLGVVMLRVLGHTVQVQGAAAVSLATLAFLCVTSFKILISVALLGIACKLISHHQQENKPSTDVSSPVRSIKDSATSPTRPHTPVSASVRRSLPVGDIVATQPTAEAAVTVTPTPATNMPNLNSTPLFSNSAVSIMDVCLNEEMLRVGLESIGEENLTRSVPNIQQEAAELTGHPESRSPSPGPVKRAESEPSIPHALETEGDTPTD